MSVGGSIQEISLGGRIFSVASDAESNRKLGGFENEVLANGDSTARLIKTRVPLMLDGLALDTSDTRGDHEYLQNLADSNDFFVIIITYASQISYQGSAQLTGEIQRSSQAATTTVTLSGPGILTRQS